MTHVTTLQKDPNIILRTSLPEGHTTKGLIAKELGHKTWASQRTCHLGWDFGRAWWPGSLEN